MKLFYSIITAFFFLSSTFYVRAQDSLTMLKYEETIEWFNLQNPQPERQRLDKTWSFKTESALSKGKWVKLGISQNGIYKVDYSDMKNWGFDVDNINPENIAIFANGFESLPEFNNEDRVDDLDEIAIMFYGNDNKSYFIEGDFILFYGNGPLAYKFDSRINRFRHFNNIYSDTVYYFLTVKENAGKRIQIDNSDYSESVETVKQFPERIVHEFDSVNLEKYGRTWLGEKITNGKSRFVDFNIKDHMYNGTVTVDLSLAYAKFNTNTKVNVKVNEMEYSQELKRVIGSYTNYKLWEYSINQLLKDQDNLKVEINYQDKLFINYILINYPRLLIYDGGFYEFRNFDYDKKIKELAIKANKPIGKILDITDRFNIKQIDFSNNNGYCNFRFSTDKDRNFVAFDNKSFSKPLFIESVDNQNLHAEKAVNLVIVYHPLFSRQAEQLADFRRTNDNLSVLTVTPQQIYNEYSGGKQDPTAIRMFMKNLYDKDNGNTLRYLLLLGDGSYDPKGKDIPNTNFIVTFQSEESLETNRTYVCEDYFGILGDSDGINGKVNIGVGRLTVKNVQEAQTVIDKIISYGQYIETNKGDWRNNFSFVADDEDNNGHIYDAEVCADFVKQNAPYLNINKIYFDAYKKEFKDNGKFFPGVKQAINDNINNGTVIMNYFGHASEIGWSEEKVLGNTDIFQWSNKERLAIIISASCQFGRFDLPSKTSAGENALLHSNGGTIATLTSTRLAYPSNNLKICEGFYNSMFSGNWNYRPRLGDFYKDAKNISGNLEGNFQFSMLGDPSIILPVPIFNVKISSVNNISNPENADVKALDQITVKGKIYDSDNNFMSEWNGWIMTTLLDKLKEYATLANEQTSFIMAFYMQNEELFKGKTIVKNGEFELTFRIPKSINYDKGAAKLSFYALDTLNFNDAKGYYNELILGDINESVLDGACEPVITTSVNNSNGTDFAIDYKADGKLILNAEISDPTGLFNSDISNGRNTTISIDGGKNSNVSDILQYEPGNFNKVWFSYELPNWDNGNHTVTIKSYNVCEISASKTLNIKVSDKADLKKSLEISNVKCFPNPASSNNKIKLTFDFESENNLINADIYVFDINGALIKHFDNKFAGNIEGLNKFTLEWHDNDNILNDGIYIYKIYVRDDNGNKAETSCKFMFKRQN